MSIEAMKQALEASVKATWALAHVCEKDKTYEAVYDELCAMTPKLRAAIEQAEKQEPYGWVYEWDGKKHFTFTDQRFVEQAHPHFNKSTPVYITPRLQHKWVEVECPLCGEMAVAHTHPNLKKREWVGLTDEQRRAEFAKLYPSDDALLNLAENNRDFMVEAIGARHHWNAFQLGSKSTEAKLKEINHVS